MLSALLLTLAATPAPVTVLFAGDVTLGYHYEEYLDERISKGVAKDEALGWGFERVRGLTTKADLFVVNLECPFTTSGQKLMKNFNFRARPELVASLLAGGVDAVSLANNHLVDYGPEGLAETVSTLDGAKIVHFGAGRSLADARAPRIVDVKGVKVALLGYFFLGENNIEPKEVTATAQTPGVAGHAELGPLQQMVTTDVRAAKAKADHVIVFFHWGREGRTQPEPYQPALARTAIDAGASAVIGSHPHVLQGMERYKGAPIFYSLGNFVFGGNWDPRDKRSALVELTLDRASVKTVRVIPAFSDEYPARPCQPYLAEGDEATAVLTHLAEISSGLSEPLAELAHFRPADAGVAGVTDAGAGRDAGAR